LWRPQAASLTLTPFPFLFVLLHQIVIGLTTGVDTFFLLFAVSTKIGIMFSFDVDPAMLASSAC
jgi:hypothetical protein